MNLESLGAGSTVADAFQTYASQGMVLGRVAVAQRDQYRLYTEPGEVSAEPSGALWYRAPDRASMPVVGDWVAARVVGTEHAIVEAVLPRRTCFSRRAAGRREEEQPIAANIDLVFLVCGLDGDFNLRRLERYMTLAAESGARPVLVLNKADLCPVLDARLAETASVARGAPVVAASTRTPGGTDALSSFLAPGRTVALLGSSGVGKSSIANRILGEEYLRTAEVRPSDSRGRHTTPHRELMPLPAGGALIDTPGMRELQLWAGQDSVDRAFEEIAALAARCRFRDCSHTGEQGCAVESAVAEGAIGRDRWESYRKLLAEARRHEELADPLAAQERKRRLKRIHKAQREHYKSRR
jgi:ribosome biogenesis GTPase